MVERKSDEIISALVNRQDRLEEKVEQVVKVWLKIPRNCNICETRFSAFERFCLEMVTQKKLWSACMRRGN